MAAAAVLLESVDYQLQVGTELPPKKRRQLRKKEVRILYQSLSLIEPADVYHLLLLGSRAIPPPRNRRSLRTKRGPSISDSHSPSRGYSFHSVVWPYIAMAAARSKQCATSHLAITEHVLFCVVILTLD